MRKIKFNYRYAIGELIILVLGISIAFYLENQRVARSEKETETKVIKQLVRNLENDLQDLRFNLASDQKTAQMHDVLIRAVEDQLPYHDSLSTYFGRMGYFTNFFSNSSAYDNLKSIGMRFISNDSLRDMIIDYYDVNTQYLLKIEDYFNRHEYDIVAPFMIRNFDYSSIFYPAFPNNYETLMKTPTYKSIIQTTRKLIDWKIDRSQISIDQAEELKDLLLDELEKTEN